MDIDRNFSFLCSVDTKKYSINESKSQMQSSGNLEFRGSTQKPSVEMSFSHLFGLQTLITNVEILCNNHHSFEANFQNVEIQTSSLTNRGHYNQLINPKLQKQGNLQTFSGLGLTHCVKISFTLRSESRRKNIRQTQKQIQQYYQKVFNDCVKQINLYGIAINSNPSSILLTKLLNIAQSFKRYNLLQQAAEANILVALSLISARRFILAAEILRKVSKFYLEKYNNSKSIMDLNRTDRSVVRQFDDDAGHSTNRSNFGGGGRILEGSKFLQRAAKIELLIAQTSSHPSLVLEKLQAYHRCDSYASGNINPSPLRPDADLEEVALSIFHQIIQFLLKVLSDKLEPFRIAALKSIQFFIETLGCSIGSAFLQILKQVIITYPNSVSSEINSNRIPYGLQEVDIMHEKTQQLVSGIPVMKNKMLIDHYHHLLETLLSLMSLANRKLVISLFSEIIMPSILSKNQSHQLKLYLLRFSEKSIYISGADLNIQISFVGLLLSFCEQKNVSKHPLNSQLQKSNGKNQSSGKRQEGSGPGQNKQILHNLVYFSQKILSTLKLKVLPRYSEMKMSSFLEWVNKTLTYLGQNQILSNTNSNHSLFVFTTILDFIVSIYSVLKYDSIRLTNSPIETVLYFANLAIYNQQAGLPFDKILQALVVLIKYHNHMDTNFELDVEIVSRILEKSKEHNLSLKQLQILIKIIEILKEEDTIVLEWLQVYLGCIPHSTYDETYKVFCLMLQKGMKQIHNYPKKGELLKKIVKTMLDQYTVKGKAHQQAKQTLIQTLMKNKPSSILDLIEVCLFNNEEPKPQAYYSRRKLRGIEKSKKDIEHRFDSKTYKIDYQMFVEKISMTQLVLSTISLSKQVCLTLVEESFLEKFFACMKNMIETPSMKIKGKALSLINHYLSNTVHAWKDEKFRIKPFFLIARHIFNLSKSLVFKLKESKLMYSSIFNIINLFRFYEIETEAGDSEKEPENQIQKTFEETQEWIKIQATNKSQQVSKSKGQRMINLLLVKEFLKLWPNLAPVLNSCWEHVRQIYVLLIIEVFKQGLCGMPQILKKKTLQICKPLLSNLFKSIEHSEREAGLKIFGCLLGLRGSFENRDNRIGSVVGDNLKYLKCYVEKIHELTFDCHQKNVEIADNLCEICLSQESSSVLNQRRKQLLNRKGSNLQNSYLSFNLEEEINFQRKNFSNLTGNSAENQLFRQSWLIDEQSLPLEEVYCPNITEELLYKIVQFKNMIQKQIQAKTEVFGEKQSFLEQNEQQFYDMGEERAESLQGKQKSEDDQLQFEDLGIIELDDEEWGEEEQKSEKEIQKLPLKKNYKLSPNVFNASKPQRIRSKRFHQNQFDYRQKIIVDELQQKITNSNQQTNKPLITTIEQKINGQDILQIPNIPNSGKLQNPQKEEKSEKKELRRQNFMEPQVVEDLDLRDDSGGQEFDSHLDRRAQKWDKELKKQKQRQKQEQVNTQIKDKEMEKKSKKQTKKRKASLGK